METTMTGKPHTVKSYDDALLDIDRSIERMGALAAQQLLDSYMALESCNGEWARRVIGRDGEIDAIERRIDEAALGLIALRQPMAVDLRHIAAAMKIAGDIERVGDLAKNIAARSLEIDADSPMMAKLPSLRQMLELAEKQLADVVRSYSKCDAALAEAVWRRDAALDNQHRALFRTLLTYMMEDARNISACVHLLFAAKNS